MGFEDVRVGDTVTRMLAGVIPMTLRVIGVDATFIYCGGGWKFLRTTGAEVDEDLHWDGITKTGSVLTKEPVKIPPENDLSG